ncbi:tetratricopeptide repeat protein [Bordetella hinzii]|nr:tetratricopeptide repeat protein [Bordetella hinzii]
MKKIISMFFAERIDSPLRRRAVSRLFKIRKSFFSGRKKFEKIAYPARIIDPLRVYGENYPGGKFHLIGKNWLDQGAKKPIALLWGFNAWKVGFISDYLPGYRTLFAPRKIFGWHALYALMRFPERPSVFIFWGMTEPWLVCQYAKLKRMPILRMEDGFLRSANLGAAHSTPYSLLLDSRGIHYNPDGNSDLRDVLNNYEFSESELHHARECLDLLSSMRLSKYNPPTLNISKGSGIKIRRRVAVIGQVDSDRSITLGNFSRWSMKEVIQLAKIENPDADIVYRPHPDVYKGYQRSRFAARSVQNICEIVDPEIALSEFLDTVDQVYTLTSLSGLEALFRGVKVTVLGAAFYGGWGLTDDRFDFRRYDRNRSRTLEELFAAIYLKYPRYLANLRDSVAGFKATCLAISVDAENGRYEALRKGHELGLDLLIRVASSDHWPQVLFGSLDEGAQISVVSSIDFGSYFKEGRAAVFQTAIVYAICGICRSDNARDTFLRAVRQYVEPAILGELLHDLSMVYPGSYVAKHLAWLLSGLRNPDASLDVLSTQLDNTVLARAAALKHAMEQAGDDEAVQTAGLQLLTPEQASLKLEIFDYSLHVRDLDRALGAAKSLLLAGYYADRLLPALAELAEIRFDFLSARQLARLSYYQQPSSPMAAIQARTADRTTVLKDPMQYLATLARVVMLRPGKLAFCLAMLERFEDTLDVENLKGMLKGMLLLDGRSSIGMAQALMAMELPDDAVRVMEDVVDAGDNSANARVAYAQALSFAGRLQDAIATMKPVLRYTKTSLVYREMLRLYILAGDYENGLAMVDDAIQRRIDIGEMLPRKIYFGARQVKKALITFTELPQTLSVKKYYREKYLDLDAPHNGPCSIALLAIFGPGDELRFASIYNMLKNMFVGCFLSATCDPRLLSLFERSFPHIRFHGVRRLRDRDPVLLENYTKVPGSDISYIVNDTAVDCIDGADRVCVVTDLLHKCLPDYSAFTGHAYLIADESLQRQLTSRLPQGKLLVGLSWRSSITTHSRNEHYLTIEELEPLFRLENVQFVNLQYDDCVEELSWVENRYPGKVINFADIDQFNDFESVAALMKSMDLIIAPATTVVELAGALGCPTWMISNSSELHWRKVDDNGTDVWHSSIVHVEGGALGDKNSLVLALRDRLAAFVAAANDAAMRA